MHNRTISNTHIPMIDGHSWYQLSKLAKVCRAWTRLWNEFSLSNLDEQRGLKVFTLRVQEHQSCLKKEEGPKLAANTYVACTMLLLLTIWLVLRWLVLQLPTESSKRIHSVFSLGSLYANLLSFAVHFWVLSPTIIHHLVFFYHRKILSSRPYSQCSKSWVQNARDDLFEDDDRSPRWAAHYVNVANAAFKFVTSMLFIQWHYKLRKWTKSRGKWLKRSTWNDD